MLRSFKGKLLVLTSERQQNRVNSSSKRKGIYSNNLITVDSRREWKGKHLLKTISSGSTRLWDPLQILGSKLYWKTWKGIRRNESESKFFNCEKNLGTFFLTLSNFPAIAVWNTFSNNKSAVSNVFDYPPPLSPWLRHLLLYEENQVCRPREFFDGRETPEFLPLVGGRIGWQPPIQSMGGWRVNCPISRVFRMFELWKTGSLKTSNYSENTIINSILNY